MNTVKIAKFDDYSLTFDDGTILCSQHDQDCCESHYLCLSDFSIVDFNGLEFDLSNDNFFERIDGFGIALKPTNGHPVRIPGYGYNNGYYSSQLDLVLTRANGDTRVYDVSECQVIEG